MASETAFSGRRTIAFPFPPGRPFIRWLLTIQHRSNPMKALKFALFLPLAAAPLTHAAAIEWNNTGTNFATSSNWVGGVLPANSSSIDTGVFGSIGAAAVNPNLAQNRIIAGISFPVGAYSYDLGGIGILTLGGSGITHDAANTQTFTLPLALVSIQPWTTAAGGLLLVNGPLDLNPSTNTSRTLTIAGAGNTTISGPISTSFVDGSLSGITVTSTGITILSGGSSYAGVTRMNAAGGVLTLSGNNSAASGGVTLTSGTLNVNSANALGTGTFLFSSGATLNNTSGAAITNAGNNAVTYGSNTTSAMMFGTGASTSLNNLDLGTGIATASTDRSLTVLGTGVTFSLGTLNVTSTSTTGRTLTFDGAGNTVVLRGLNIAANSPNAVTAKLAGSADLSITGVIANGSAFANGINIDRTGLTVLSGTNTYTGETKFTNGTVQVSGPEALSSGSTLTTGTSSALTGTLNLTTASAGYTMNQLSVGGIIRFTGPVSGTSTITFTNGGAITGTSSGRTIDAGAGTTVLINGANFDLIGAKGADNRNVNFIVNGALTFNAVLQDNGSDTSIGFIGGFTKTGSGVLTLAAASTYGGTTNVTEGTLLVNGPKSGIGSTNVAVGATIGGSASLAGILNAAGTVAPGNAGIGTLNTGEVNLTGALAVEINGATSDKLVSSGDIDVTGATLNVSAVGAGFTESSYVIAEGTSITGEFAPAPGYAITYSGTQIILSLSGADPYTAWANSFGLQNPWLGVDPALNGNMTGDPDNDGQTNLTEYAFGLIPTSGASVSPIRLPLDKGTGLFTYTRRKPSLTNLTYTYEYSTTLSGAWLPFTPDSVASNSGNPVEEIIVDVPNDLLANPKLFVRVTAK